MGGGGNYLLPGKIMREEGLITADDHFISYSFFTLQRLHVSYWG